jgi:regulatory protein
MILTGLRAQVNNKNRVNVMVDGVYRFSVDVGQVLDLKLQIGKSYTEEELLELEDEGLFGKLYGRSLEYCLTRLHSGKEVRDYLYRKTRDTRTKTGTIKKGVSLAITERVYEKLVARGYIDDEKFARNWIENRSLKRGISKRKLQSELQLKGISSSLIHQLLNESNRTNEAEIEKVITKKRARYPDEAKFKLYLLRQGFSYDDINHALSSSSSYD